MNGLTQEEVIKELGLEGEKNMFNEEEIKNAEGSSATLINEPTCLDDMFATDESITENMVDIEQAKASVATSSPDATDTSAWAEAGMKGFFKVNDCTAVYEHEGNKLTVRLSSSILSNKRKYLLGVCDEDGFYKGAEDKKAYFTPKQIEDQAPSIDAHLKNLVEDFTGCIADIKAGIAIIEKHRLLSPKPIDDFGSFSIEELYHRLGIWFIKNVDDSRVAVFDIRGSKHICLCQRGDKTPSKIFKEVFAEVAENNLNRPEIFKRELYDKGLFIHDVGEGGRDYQLTVSRSIQSQLGLANDKVISIKFPEETMNKIIENHNRICSQKDDLMIWLDDCEEVEDTSALEIAQFIIVKPDGEVELYG